MSAGREYERLVGLWQEVTRGYTWPATERCCEVVRDGAPECCFQLVDGEKLTFTAPEVRALEEIWGEECASWKFEPYRGVFRYRTELLTKEQHVEALHTGWMAQTIECSSHPLRPIIGAHLVVMGSAAVNACNLKQARREYVRARDEIRDLWQETVDLFGVKPYYGTTRINGSWVVL